VRRGGSPPARGSPAWPADITRSIASSGASRARPAGPAVGCGHDDGNGVDVAAHRPGAP
jgi:hypothetical protein